MTARKFLVAVAAVSLFACGDDSTGNNNSSNNVNNQTTADAGQTTNNVETDAGGTDAGEEPMYETPAADCDSLDESHCALPWPSSLYLAKDETKPTGYRLAFGATTLPANAQNRHMKAELFDRFDGYGFGTPIMTLFPNVDVSDLPTEADIAPSVESTSKSLLFKVTDSGLEQVPHWIELDGFEEDAAQKMLFMRQAVILDQDSRYIVAFRDLQTTDGSPIEPSSAFAALRDGAMTDDPAVESRREAFETMFAELESAGVERDSLVLAWDFRTGSEANLHSFADAATELALEAVGEAGATFEFTEVQAFSSAPDGDNYDPNTAYRITGTMTTPSVLDSQSALNKLAYDADALALSEPASAPIHITIPHTATDGNAVGVLVYGHGMLGSSSEVFAGHLREMGQALGYIFVGVDFKGMSSADVNGVVAAMFDMSGITHLTEGTVQGIAQTHVLAHAATTSLPGALQAVDSNITLTDDVQWVGASQGGIYGASILATSRTFERGILAVPGNNYSMLLSRSVNFEPFFDQLQNSYETFAKIHIVVAATQLQWDVSDPVTFWRRLAQDEGPNGLRDSLLLVSKGDKQVAVVTNEILARTYSEVPLMTPYDSERTPWGAATTTYPHQGSGQVLFDFGNPWPLPEGNTPPDNELPDPHSRIAEVPEAAGLIGSFLVDSTIVDVCGGDGCAPN